GAMAGGGRRGPPGRWRGGGGRGRGRHRRLAAGQALRPVRAAFRRPRERAGPPRLRRPPGPAETGMGRRPVRFATGMTTVGSIGSGNIGGTVARLAVAAGYDVVLSNSRGPDTLDDLVAELGPHARAATAAQAGAAGELV